MQGRRVFALYALLLAPGVMAAQESKSLNADDLVRIGISQNNELLSIRERIAEAKGTARQAGVRPAPVVTLKGVTGRPLGTFGEEQYGADYSQPVETFGKRAKRIEFASFGIEQAEAELQERSAELAFAIRSGAAQREAELRKIKLLDDLAALNSKALGLTEARVKEGDVAPLEASLLRVEINRGLVLKTSAQSRLTAAEMNLRKLIGLRADQTVPSTDSPIPVPEPLEALKQRAVSARADLRGARLLEDQSRSGIGLARANAKPDVNLSLGYTRQNSQFDDLFGQTPTGAVAPLKDRDDLLTFGVSIPLRTSRSGRGDIEAAAARTSGARLRREYLERNISLEVESAYQQWTAAQRSLELLRTGVIEPSAQNLQVIQEAYRLGQLRLLDVLNEQRRLADNELAYIDAQADAARTWAEVQRAIGGNLP